MSLDSRRLTRRPALALCHHPATRRYTWAAASAVSTSAGSRQRLQQQQQPLDAEMVAADAQRVVSAPGDGNAVRAAPPPPGSPGMIPLDMAQGAVVAPDLGFTVGGLLGGWVPCWRGTDPPNCSQPGGRVTLGFRCVPSWDPGAGAAQTAHTRTDRGVGGTCRHGQVHPCTCARRMHMHARTHTHTAPGPTPPTTTPAGPRLCWTCCTAART